MRKRGFIQDGKSPCRSGMGGERKRKKEGEKGNVEERHQQKVSQLLEGGSHAKCT